MSDLVFVIGAPILSFIWALATLRIFGAEIVWNIFIIFNVAHHFPTFIRIYGDKDCFKRFKWSLVLGPVIPFSAGLLLSYYTVSNGYPIQTLFMVLMVVTLWDPWHFLMQHYGFMRIYDRHNAAPARLASWMDYAISLSWFGFIMLATTEWFIDRILYPLFNDNGFRFLLWIEPAVYHALIGTALALAVAASFVYLGYIIWCWKKGYFVSPAKICLLVITFGMMYLTYVPNSFLRANDPNWEFSVGFATLGMVHVTQYLAIVWKYNRGLAARGDERSRSGVFAKVFSRGGFFLAAMYVAVCLIYGAFFSNDSPVISGLQAYGLPSGLLTAMSCLIVTIGFTSTFIHYYYDGFIWKFRHKENRENLVVQPDAKGAASRGKKGVQGKAVSEDGSWWTKVGGTSFWARFRRDSFGSTVLRQACYFGVPISILILTFLYLGQAPRSTAHLAPSIDTVVGLSLRLENKGEESDFEMLSGIMDRIDLQMQAEKRVAELCPLSSEPHERKLAFLYYSRARGQMSLSLAKDRISGPARTPTAQEIERYREDVGAAVQILEKQTLPDENGFFTDEQLSDLEYLEQWKTELAT